jgi:uncharacterized membrane protein YciS (DUF1049 family)
MFDFISFLEGIIIGAIFVGLWFSAFSIDTPRFQKKIEEMRNKSDNKPAIIIKKNPLDLEEILKDVKALK